LGVLRKVKAVNPSTVVVLISAFATAETAVEAMKEGAYDYIPKPFKVHDFKRIIAEALKSSQSALQADAFPLTKNGFILVH
jgi:two-component system response regulator PilR (NtrC family)